jgi:threonine dehydrogenase-like Zn-dependent dehydrogenase
VTCSIAYHRPEFERSIAMMAAGRVLAAPLHTQTVDLDHLADAFDALSSRPPSDVKILVRP